MMSGGTEMVRTTTGSKTIPDPFQILWIPWAMVLTPASSRLDDNRPSAPASASWTT